MENLTLTKLNKEYESMKKENIDCIILYIHMPTGENEIIVNSNVEEKMKYINKTYNENLVHKNCKDIYITEFIFGLDEVEGMNFGEALDELRYSNKIARKGWNGKGLYVQLENGGDYKFSEILPFFVIKNNKNAFNTWVPSVSDLLAEDWEVIE